MCINSILFKMDNIKRQLKLGLALVALTTLLTIVPQPTSGYALHDSGQTINGCYHNGTWYAEASIVPTMEPCLICKCLSRTMICALKICPEQPIPPPRGCVLVHRKGACCSHLSCTKFHLPSFHSDDRRLVMLAEADRNNNRYHSADDSDLDYDNDSNEKSVLQGHNHLRRSDDEDSENEVCIFNGTIYESGSAMSSSTLCSYCYCIGGKQKCVKPKCLLSSPKCKPIYADSTCCPIKYDCSGEEKAKNHTTTFNHITKKVNKHYLRNSLRSSRSNGCLMNGYFYPEGQKLPVDPAQPCDICFCIRGAKKCTPKQCAPPIRNCQPRVPRGQCCAASYDCSQISRARGINQNDDADSFDFFSLLFGPEEPENVTITPTYSTTTEPSTASGGNTTEKSFFDFIREGLKLIDSNEETIGNVLEQGNQSISVVKFVEPTTAAIPTVTEPPTTTTTTAKPTTTASTTTTTKRATTTVKAKVEPPPIMDLKKDVDAKITEKLSELAKVVVLKHRDSDIIKIIPTSPPPKTEEIAKTTTTFVRPNVIERIVGGVTTEEPTKTSAATTATSTARTTTSSVAAPTTRKATTKRTTNSTATTSMPQTTTVKTSNTTRIASAAVVTKTTGTRKPAPARTQKPPTVPKKKIAVKSNSTQATTTTTTSKSPTSTPTTTTSKPATVDTPSLIDELSKISIIIENKHVLNPTPDGPIIRTNDKFAKGQVTVPPPIIKANSTTGSATKSPTTYTTRTMTRPTTPVVIMKEITTVPSQPSPTTTATSKPVTSTTSLPASEQFTSSSSTESESTAVTSSEESSSTASSTSEESEMSSSVSASSSTTSTEMPAEHRTESMEMSDEVSTTKVNATAASTTENILSVFFSELSNILDGKKNSSLLEQKMKKNATKYPVHATISPLTPKPTPPVNLLNKISTNPSILEADYNYDYNEPTLPPSLPNLKIIPFLPADAVNNNNRNQVKYDYYKPPNPTPSYPSITEKYDANHYVVGGADLERYNMNPTSYPNENVYGILGKNANSKIDYDVYDPTENYNAVNPTMHSVGESDSGNNNIRYNTKFIRDKYDPEYDDYESPELKYVAHDKMDTIPKIVIDSKYHPNQNTYSADPDKSYINAYDKFGNNYPDKSVYYNVYDSAGYNTENPVYNFEDSAMSGFSPPTKTEGGFLPKEPSKDKFFYDKFLTTNFNVDQPTKAPPKINATHGAVFKNPATKNPFKDVIRTEPAPDLHSLIEDKEKLLSNRFNYSSIIHLNHTIDNNDFEKDIISITTDIDFNNASDITPPSVPLNKSHPHSAHHQDTTTPSAVKDIHKEAMTMSSDAPPAVIHSEVDHSETDFTSDEDMYPTSTGSSDLGSTAAESPDMFSFENVFNYLFRDENPVNDNKLYGTTSPSSEVTIPPFKSIPLSMPALTSFTSPASDSTEIDVSTETAAVTIEENVSSSPAIAATTAKVNSSSPAPVAEQKVSTTSTTTTVTTDTDIATLPASIEAEIKGITEDVGDLTTADSELAVELKVSSDGAGTMAVTMKPNVNHTTTIVDDIVMAPPVKSKIKDVPLRRKSTTPRTTTERNVRTSTTYTPSLSDLPFLNPAFHLKTSPEKATEKIQPSTFNPVRSDLNFLLPELKNDIDRFGGNQFNRDADLYQVLPEDSAVSNTEPYVINPVDMDKLKQHHSEGTAEIFTKPTNINKDAVGILKLAGCNIYGRMYRVGRIISELSGPCLECKCTEVGVHCTPLNC